MKRPIADRNKYRAAIVRAIAPYTFWSYSAVDPSEISDENLIEAVLVDGDDPLKSRLFRIFSKNKIRNVWERRLVIQDARLHILNRKIASELLHLNNPEDYIQRAYKKYNLYERFSG